MLLQNSNQSESRPQFGHFATSARHQNRELTLETIVDALNWPS